MVKASRKYLFKVILNCKRKQKVAKLERLQGQIISGKPQNKDFRSRQGDFYWHVIKNSNKRAL